MTLASRGEDRDDLGKDMGPRSQAVRGGEDCSTECHDEPTALKDKLSEDEGGPWWLTTCGWQSTGVKAAK